MCLHPPEPSAIGRELPVAAVRRRGEDLRERVFGRHRHVRPRWVWIGDGVRLFLLGLTCDTRLVAGLQQGVVDRRDLSVIGLYQRRSGPSGL